MGNAVAAGFIAGGVLARKSGPRGAVLGGIGFAAFSAAIDWWMKRETAEYVL
jgi:mitochondrial import inner membrane translocase subunit TIM22